MRIEIWSDVVCPWCYIGKRRLEKALAGFEHRDEVEVIWRSYQLDPSAPTEPTEPVAAALARKYGGGPERIRQMMGQVQAVAAEEGLDFSRHGEGLHLNTVDAHRLLHASGERRSELKEAFLNAYFVEARNLADHDVLRELAVGVGLDGAEVDAVLAGDRFADEVAQDVEEAQQLGAGGVPFFVIDRRFGISGAQPVEVFARALEQAWAASAPLTMVDATTSATGSGSAGACEGDVCAT